MLYINIAILVHSQEVPMKKVRIGSGAGFAGDRVDPAIELIKNGNLDYIIFECLAERTIGLARQEMLADPSKGYSRLLEYRMSQVLKPAKENGVKIISNMGAVNPKGAVDVISGIAEELGIKGLKCAYVTGDDVYDRVSEHYDDDIFEFPGKVRDYKDVIVSANAYIGAEGIMKALSDGADIVITGRVSDPTLTIAPMRHEFGWTIDDNPDQIGQCVLAGHLIECGGQVTGGYYADPGYKEVEGLENLGFPIVEMDETGRFTISKPEGTGGLVSVDTCKEQMLYEIHNPKAYITPDGIADFSQVKFSQLKKDLVEASGATTHGMPPTLKVNVCYKDSFITDCEISYGGRNALKRARLSGEIFEKRIDRLGVEYTEKRIDYIGYNSLYGNRIASQISDENCGEIRLHAAYRTKDRKNAVMVSNEGDSIYTNGPAGGGGATMKISEIINVFSYFIDPSDIVQKVEYKEI